MSNSSACLQTWWERQPELLSPWPQTLIQGKAHHNTLPRADWDTGGHPGLPPRQLCEHCPLLCLALSLFSPTANSSISKVFPTAVTQNLSNLEQKFSKYTEVNPGIPEFHKKRICVWGGIIIQTNPVSNTSTNHMNLDT